MKENLKFLTRCAPIAKILGKKILNVNIKKHLGIPHSNVLDVAEQDCSAGQTAGLPEQDKQQDCRVKTAGMAGAALEQKDSTQERSVGNILSPLNENMEQSIGVEECIMNNKLLLANGKSVPIITNECQVKDVNQPMPVTKGTIGSENVSVLRASGCSSVVVKKKFMNKPWT